MGTYPRFCYAREPLGALKGYVPRVKFLTRTTNPVRSAVGLVDLGRRAAGLRLCLKCLPQTVLNRRIGANGNAF